MAGFQPSLIGRFWASPEAGTAGAAVEFSLQAAAAAERRHADGDAASFLRHGLEIGRRFGLLDDEHAAALLLRLGQRRFGAGDRASAREALREAFDLGVRLGKPELFARAAIAFVGPTAPIHVEDGERELLRRALDLLPRSEAALRAELLLSLAQTYRYAYSADRAAFESATVEARYASSFLDRPDLDLLVLTRELESLSWRDDLVWERELTHSVETVLSTSSDDALTLLMRSLLVRSYLERAMPAEEAGQIAAIARSARSGKRALAMWLSALHDSMQALRSGRFHEALRFADAAYAAGRFLDPMSGAILAAQVLFAHREMGLGGAARATAVSDLERHYESVHDVPSNEMARQIASWLGMSDHGWLPEYRAEAERGFPNLVDDRTEGTVIVALLSEFCAAAEDVDGAAALVPWVDRWAGRIVVVADAAHLCLGAVSGYGGLVHSVLGLWAEAEAAFRDAIERNERAGASLWAMHARCDFARMLGRRRGAGDDDRARELISSVRPWAQRRDAKRLLSKVAGVEDLLRARAGASAGDRAPPSTAAPDPSRRLRFQRAGHGWTIGDRDREVQLRDMVGLRYLEVLLRHPSRSFPAAELVQQVRAHTTALSNDSKGALNAAPADPAGAHVALERAREIGEELEEARSWNDLGRVEKLREELELLERGRRGVDRFRSSNDADERIRKAVTNRIRDAIRRISRELPDLGAHLERCVKTGASCVYDAKQPLSWDL